MKSVMSAPFRGFRGTTNNSEFVFFMRGGNAFARAKVIPANPQTDDQTKIRAYLSAATKNWALLTDAQRADWLAWGQKYLNNTPGDTTIGLDAYVAANSIRQVLGLSLTTAAPTSGPPSPVTGLAIEDPGTDLEVSFHVTHTIASGSVSLYKLLVKETPMMGTAAQNPRLPLARYIENVSPNSAKTLVASGSTPYVFTDPRYIPAISDRYGLAAYIVETATGLASQPFFTTVTQVGP